MAFQISGEYLDENGDPVEGATVIANERATGDPVGLTTTDSDGLFDLIVTSGDLIYVAVFQDGFAPRIFDQITPDVIPDDADELLLEDLSSLLLESGDSLLLE